jgi:hypothetical protein
MSQQSELRSKLVPQNDEHSPDISPFDKNGQGECTERDKLKQDLRRSVTEAMLQENRPLPDEPDEKEIDFNPPISQFTAKTRRTPTDIQETGKKQTPGNREKADPWSGKNNLGGYKVSPLKTDNDQKQSKAVNPRNKVVPNSSSRAMLEFSEPLTAGRISTEHIFLPEHQRSPSPGKSKVLHTKDRLVAPREVPSSGEQKKSCLKRDSKASPTHLNDLEDNFSQRNLSVSSPVGSKKGILTNKTKVVPNESLSVYEMAHLPLKRSNTQMSRKSPTKVRFSEKPIIFEVESYKRYYKESYSEKECCSECVLI